MAKDVVEFLNWAAEPEMDQRKKMGVAVITITSVLLALSIWVKRFVVIPYFPPTTHTHTRKRKRKRTREEKRTDGRAR